MTTILPMFTNNAIDPCDEVLYLNLMSCVYTNPRADVGNIFVIKSRSVQLAPLQWNFEFFIIPEFAPKNSCKKAVNYGIIKNPKFH